jgi:hypothetical protein
VTPRAALKLDRGDLVLTVRIEPDQAGLASVTRALADLGVGILDVQVHRAVQALARDLGINHDPTAKGGHELGLQARRVLTSTRRAMHYREIMDTLEASGVRIRGKDPAATLLTNLNRDERITRTARGHYALKETP